MMNSYKVKSNLLMASSNNEKIYSHMLSSNKDKANLQMPSSYEDKRNFLMLSNNESKSNSKALSSNYDKISSLMTKAYRDKVNLLILNDFKIYEGKALMKNPQVASERRCCSYD